MVIKRSLHEQHPWLARSITKAFSSSLEYAYDAIAERAALRYILPWLQDHVEETQKCVRVFIICIRFALTTTRAFGTHRYWEDGLEKNKHVIAKFLEYSYSQGLAKKLWRPEEVSRILFHSMLLMRMSFCRSSLLVLRNPLSFERAIFSHNLIAE
jgi:4,5-dihydroxyphthalate decarboxylase